MKNSYYAAIVAFLLATSALVQTSVCAEEWAPKPLPITNGEKRTPVDYDYKVNMKDLNKPVVEKVIKQVESLYPQIKTLFLMVLVEMIHLPTKCS
ncbi:hypothetical protein [Brevibacillus laterosporus]|uniref:hypothetical protein n=1 Tax=Brevibacillus laterosporus TaxID=1465 RepID=UPI0018CEC5CB|nr:hypothetical protein [Brevibacillus laterosporus]MBG9789178.1 hypothetical protein [Brevibacillus laterosporus]